MDEPPRRPSPRRRCGGRRGPGRRRRPASAGTSAANTAVRHAGQHRQRRVQSTDSRVGFTSGFRNIDSSSLLELRQRDFGEAQMPSGTPSTAPMSPRTAASGGEEDDDLPAGRPERAQDADVRRGARRP